MSLAEDIGKLDYEVRTFIDSIESVTIYEGLIKDDPKTWEIKLKGLEAPLRIDAEELTRVTRFERTFLKLTNTPAPYFRANDWILTLKYMAEIATLSTEKEESDNVFIAKSLFELIGDLKEIKKQDATRIKGYVSHEGYRCVHLYTIKELMEGLNFKLTPRIMSTTLTQLGYKDEGTPGLWVKELNKVVRFWWFKEELFLGGVEQ